MVFLGFPFCIPLVYSLSASCSFFIYILLFTDQKQKKLLLTTIKEIWKEDWQTYLYVKDVALCL